MDASLNVVIWLIGSGVAFFLGAGMILAAIALTPWTTKRWPKLARNLLVLVGGIVVAVSAAPLPIWAYAVLFVLTAAWLILESAQPAWFGARGRRCRVVLACAWVAAVIFEASYQFTPTLPALGQPMLFLIGDSVSAGMTEGDKDTWPKLLAADQGIDVRDLSRMGATVRSARKQAARIGDSSGLVLLEIGGNDLLGSTDADRFEAGLEQLLLNVCRADRTVVMFELPLPPFANRFGSIQRRLSAKYEVYLIPKRIFIGVLTTPGATVDGVHLSKTGHRHMAEVTWEVLKPAFARK